MRRKHVKKPSKPKTSISGMLIKTTISIPVYMTRLFIHTGEIILRKSIDLINSEKKISPAPEMSPSIRSNRKSKTAYGTIMDADTDTVFGMRPYGPKIHIRE